MKIKGLVAAVHTPFSENGELNLAVVERQAEHLLRQQIAFAFVCGSTGESHSLGFSERQKVVTRWLEVVRGTDLRVIVHVGGNVLRESRELAAQCAAQGAVAFAALAPSYFRPPDERVLVNCMAQVAQGAPDLPFYFYDIPAMTQVRLSMPRFLDLAEGTLPNLVGIKFTNEDFVALQQCLARHHGAWDILWGIDEALLAALTLGVRGAVGSSYNFAAPIYRRLLQAFDLGDLELARAEQFKSVRLIECLAKYGYLPAAKAVMEWLGILVGPARLPLVPLAEETKIKLRLELEHLGYFDWIEHG